MGNGLTITLQVFLAGTCDTREAGVLVHSTLYQPYNSFQCSGGNDVLTEKVVPYLGSASNSTLPDFIITALGDDVSYTGSYDGTCTNSGGVEALNFDNICFDADEGFYVLYGVGEPVAGTIAPTSSPVSVSLTPSLSPSISPQTAVPTLSPTLSSSAPSPFSVTKNSCLVVCLVVVFTLFEFIE